MMCESVWSGNAAKNIPLSVVLTPTRKKPEAGGGVYLGLWSTG